MTLEGLKREGWVLSAGRGLARAPQSGSSRPIPLSFSAQGNGQWNALLRPSKRAALVKGRHIKFRTRRGVLHVPRVIGRRTTCASIVSNKKPPFWPFCFLGAHCAALWPRGCRLLTPSLHRIAGPQISNPRQQNPPLPKHIVSPGCVSDCARACNTCVQRADQRPTPTLCLETRRVHWACSSAMMPIPSH